MYRVIPGFGAERFANVEGNSDLAVGGETEVILPAMAADAGEEVTQEGSGFSNRERDS